MIKKYAKIASLLALTWVGAVHAQAVTLKDNSEILGKWNLYAESTKLDGEKKPVKVEWDFESNGVLQTTATDSVGRTQEMKIAIKYFIENGEIKKQVTPGREKYESCAIVDKHDNKMTLKCTFLYFFLTKL